MDDHGATLTSEGRGGARSATGARALLVFTAAGADLVPLPAGEALTIGRGADVDVRIDEPSLSRAHARIAFGVHVTLEDLGSSNGTVVLGVPLKPRTPVVIAPGVPIALGDILVVLQLGEGEARLVGTADGSRAGDNALAAAFERVAGTDLSVLLSGESGVGKTTFAQRLHERSPRASRPLVVLSPTTAGAALGSSDTTSWADATMLLEDVSELAPPLQRALVDRLAGGGAAPRVIATTTRDPAELRASNAMLPDLLYRVSAVTIVIPPLRARVHEIASLAHTIGVDAARALGRSAPVFAPDALVLLERQGWQGNVRELRGRIETALASTTGRVLTASQFSELDEREEGPRHGGRLREAREQAEYQRIVEALRACRGNQTRAAASLGIARSTLLTRLEKYGVPRPRKG